MDWTTPFTLILLVITVEGYAVVNPDVLLEQLRENEEGWCNLISAFYTHCITFIIYRIITAIL